MNPSCTSSRPRTRRAFAAIAAGALAASLGIGALTSAAGAAMRGGLGAPVTSPVGSVIPAFSASPERVAGVIDVTGSKWSANSRIRIEGYSDNSGLQLMTIGYTTTSGAGTISARFAVPFSSKGCTTPCYLDTAYVRAVQVSTGLTSDYVRVNVLTR